MPSPAPPGPGSFAFHQVQHSYKHGSGGPCPTVADNRALEITGSANLWPSDHAETAAQLHGTHTAVPGCSRQGGYEDAGPRVTQILDAPVGEGTASFRPSPPLLFPISNALPDCAESANTVASASALTSSSTPGGLPAATNSLVSGGLARPQNHLAAAPKGSSATYGAHCDDRMPSSRVMLPHIVTRKDAGEASFVAPAAADWRGWMAPVSASAVNHEAAREPSITPVAATHLPTSTGFPNARPTGASQSPWSPALQAPWRPFHGLTASTSMWGPPFGGESAAIEPFLYTGAHDPRSEFRDWPHGLDLNERTDLQPQTLLSRGATNRDAQLSSRSDAPLHDDRQASAADMSSGEVRFGVTPTSRAPQSLISPPFSFDLRGGHPNDTQVNYWGDIAVEGDLNKAAELTDFGLAQRLSLGAATSTSSAVDSEHTFRSLSARQATDSAVRPEGDGNEPGAESTPSDQAGSRATPPHPSSTTRASARGRGRGDNNRRRRSRGDSSPRGGSGGSGRRPDGRRDGAPGAPGSRNGPGEPQRANGAPTVRDYNRRISSCARRKDLGGALNALQELDTSPNLRRNLFTYNAVINALVVCNQHVRAKMVWDEMSAAGISPNLVTYNTMLKSCFSGASGDVDRAFALVREMEENDIMADRVTLNSLINSCVAAGHVKEARQVYEQMRQRDIEPDDFTFTTLAKAGASQGNIEMLDALLVHQLNHHTRLYREQEFNGTLGKSDNAREGQSAAVHRRTSEDRAGDHGKDSAVRRICPVAYNAIADAYIRCGQPLRALELLAWMRNPDEVSLGLAVPPNPAPVEPDVQSFNVKLKALRECGAPTSEAMKAVDEMRKLNLESDHITLLTLADLCCRRGEMDLAKGVLKVATDADVRDFGQTWTESAGSNSVGGRRGNGRPKGLPNNLNGYDGKKGNGTSRSAKANASLFNALIRGYASLDPPDVESAVGLYNTMRGYVRDYGFSFYAPDAVTYTMLVDGFARIGDAKRAEEVIEEMEAAGSSSVSVVAYNALLKANRGNGSGKAFEIFNRIKARGLKPDVVTYNTMCDFLSTEENGIQLAEDLFREMRAHNVSPDLLTFNTLLKGAAKSKGSANNSASALSTAYHWLRELRKHGLRPDEFTYQSMVSACAAAGDASRALEFFRCVEEERARRVRMKTRSQSTGSMTGLEAESRRRSSSPQAQGAHAGASESWSVNDSLLMLEPGRNGHSTTDGESSAGERGRDSSLGSPQDGPKDWMLLAHPAAYIALMRAFLSSGREDSLERVLRLRDEMDARGLELGTAGYTAVADAYADRGDIENVERTLRDMTSRTAPTSRGGLAPVHHSLRMKALCNADRLDDAIAIIPEVENPDAAIFNQLIFVCTRLRDRDRLVKVLRAMEDAGVAPDSVTVKALSGLMRNLASSLRTFSTRFQSSVAKYTGIEEPGEVESDPTTGSD